MSNYPPDELFYTDFDSVSIAKVDETIEKSKKIVEMSFDASKSCDDLHRFSQTIVSENTNDYEDSLRITNNFFSNSQSLHIHNESKTLQYPSTAKYQSSLMQSRKLLKNLQAEESLKKSEIARLQEALNTIRSTNPCELEKVISKKHEEILRLSEVIKEHRIYKENKKIREKLKEYKDLPQDEKIKALFSYENSKKRCLLNELNFLSTQRYSPEFRPVETKPSACLTEKNKKIQMLCSRLEEKIIDNKRLIEKIKKPLGYSKHKHSKTSFNLDESPLKLTKKISNASSSKITLKFTRKIQTLESQLREVKKNYSELKKICVETLKKSRETQKPKSNKNKLIKRVKKPKREEKSKSCSCRDLKEHSFT